MKALSWCLLVLSLTPWCLWAEVDDLEPPHDETNGISCPTCHVPFGTAPNPPPDNWVTVNVCWSCHIDGGVAAFENIHPVEADTMWCQDCHNPHEHQTVFPQWYIYEYIDTPNSGRRNLAFIDSTDFIHGSAGYYQPYDGVCEVCHTQTSYHRNNSSGDHTHNASSSCIACHLHTDGFLPSMTSGSHATHLTADYGPHITCDDCHSASPPVFADGQNLDNTTVCNTCHSPGGTYDGVENPIIGAKYNWEEGVYQGGPAFLPGKEQWCAGCHDEVPSLIAGVAAPNVIGNEDQFTPYGMGWGYFKSGHGLPANQNYGGTGRAGAGATCLDCHNAAIEHIDGNSRTYEVDASGVIHPYKESYRLAVGLVVPRPSTWVQEPVVSDYELCFSCHDANKVFGDPLLDPSSGYYRLDYATDFRHDATGYGSWGHGGQGQVLPHATTDTTIAYSWWQEYTGRGSPGSERAFVLPDLAHPDLIYEVQDPNNWWAWFYQEPVEVVSGSTMLQDNPGLWNGGQISYAFGLPNSHYFHLSNIGSWWDWDSDWDGDFTENGNESTRSCPTCHNVHGTTFPAMIRDGQLEGNTGLQYGQDPGFISEGSYIIPYGSGTCLGLCHTGWSGGYVPREIYWYRQRFQP